MAVGFSTETPMGRRSVILTALRPSGSTKVRLGRPGAGRRFVETSASTPMPLWEGSGITPSITFSSQHATAFQESEILTGGLLMPRKS
ncbi:hypothetical protein EsH8_I_001585 [Colletotrichum jinshuiense]